MTSVCPSCGINLDRLEGPIADNLTLNRGNLFWRGEAVDLSAAENLIVQAIAGCNGHPISLVALMEFIGSTAADPCAVIRVLVHRIRRSFQAIDPSFDQIETVFGRGYRWRKE